MVEKAERVNQGDLPAGQEGVHACNQRSRRAERRGRSQSVHSSDEAPVMGVEQRERRKVET
jgi:hypothetical protein